MAKKQSPPPPPCIGAPTVEQFIDSLGLRYFRGAEFRALHARTAGSAKNAPPPPELWPHIVPTLIVLDEARHRHGAPVLINSAYRTAAYNKAVGGAAGSYHCQFMAIDSAPANANAQTVLKWRTLLTALRGQTFTNPLTKARFLFSGGIGYYPARFVHTDCRGRNTNWEG